MTRCVILDDEPFAHQVLEHYINQIPQLQLIGKYRNAVEAFEYLSHNEVDLLFLDVEMPLINGVTFLKALTVAPKTIFTTAYKQYAFDGFELNAIDYLLKPFSFERFKRISGEMLILSNKSFIPIGKNFKKQLMTIIAGLPEL